MLVKELENVGIIKTVTINKEINKHTEAKVFLYTDKEDVINSLRKLIGKEVCIEDDKRIYLRGTIRSANCETAFFGSDVFIDIVSLSDKLDEYPKMRIFQNTQKKYRDIANSLCNEQANVQITDKSFADKEENRIIVQDNITDFDFLKLIANRMGEDIFVVDTERTATVNISTKADYADKELNDINLLKYKFYKTEKKECLDIVSKDYLEIGQCILHQGVKYTVTAVTIKYKNNENIYNYRLECKTVQEDDSRYTGILGDAKVTAINDPDKLGRIQVEFLNYDEPDKNNPIWVTYLPNLAEKAQGTSLIPQIDEIVNVYCKDGKCYCDGCVRKIAYDEKIDNPEDRVFLFSDKYLAVKKDSIEFEAFDNKITVNNDKTVINKGNEVITLENGKLYIQIENSVIKLDGSKINIQSDGSFEVKTNNMKIDANTIKAKTTSFDIG